MIGLFAICLFSMPMKKLNKAWDQEDPNQAIPDHDLGVQKDVETGMDDIVPAPRTIDEDPQKMPESQHVEVAQGRA